MTCQNVPEQAALEAGVGEPEDTCIPSQKQIDGSPEAAECTRWVLRERHRREPDFEASFGLIADFEA